MERLTIDEIIAHCERETNRENDFLGTKFFEERPMNTTHMKRYWEHRQIAEWLKQLKTYKDAEEQGLLLRLPCKVGDAVWCIFERQVYKGKATRFNYWHCEYDGDYLNIDVNYDIVDPFYNDGRLMHRCDPKRYGERVFLTKEEAEQALKQMGE